MGVMASASFSVAAYSRLCDRFAYRRPALGDPARFRQRIGPQRADRNTGVFSGRPKSVECAIVQPPPRGIAEEPIP